MTSHHEWRKRKRKGRESLRLRDAITHHKHFQSIIATNLFILYNQLTLLIMMTSVQLRGISLYPNCQCWLGRCSCIDDYL